MILRKPKPSGRAGVAAVEFACIAPLMVLLLIGLWEVGRMVEVQQMLSNAVREGARQASTGVKSSSQVKTTVIDYLTQKGVTGVTTSMVTVTCLTGSDTAKEPTAATQLDRYRVSVAVPFNSYRWILLKQVTSAQTLNAQADWYSMRDVPLVINTTIPVK